MAVSGFSSRTIGEAYGRYSEIASRYPYAQGFIQIDWEELYSNPLREKERREIRKHLELCQAELKTLIQQLVGLEEGNSS